MKQLLAPNDFVLWLKAEAQRVPHVGGQCRSGLTGQRFMDVVVDSAPAGEEGAKASRIRGLAEIARVRYFNSVSDLDETLFARYRSCIGTTSRDESLPAIELKPEPEPRHRSANGALGDPAFARSEAVIDNVNEGRLTSLR
jgi:hypothetical protein